MVSLRTIREAHELTAEQLATRIDEQGVTVDPDHIYNVELGRKRGSTRLMGAWARALRVDKLGIYQASELRVLVNGEPAERESA